MRAPLARPFVHDLVARGSNHICACTRVSIPIRAQWKYDSSCSAPDDLCRWSYLARVRLDQHRPCRNPRHRQVTRLLRSSSARRSWCYDHCLAHYWFSNCPLSRPLLRRSPRASWCVVLSARSVLPAFVSSCARPVAQ